ncbi:ABC transporter ATP-binding protein (plasmid) [Sinorhizobium sp. BG8]|nr:ABC transporter ATP-binding protein [Sinorhizobium sp. BG8]
MPRPNEIAVDIERLEKKYGNHVALSDVSINIRDNEFFTLLGPSGCGKTTLLRMIAGFEEITSGRIRLFREDIADLPPNRRPLNTVFQQYALFPHMTVLENVMFGLLRLKKGREEAKARALAMLGLVQLSAFAERHPAQLSGGQQQRVALARALAPNPKVLLLDEPLSALDLKLRQAVRLELKEIQRETGITFIFVTHDQEEALTMSDRIAVMSAGQVQQVGTAREIYEMPENRFVADFIGETNLIQVTVATLRDGTAEVILPGGSRLNCAATGPIQQQPLHLSIRPERLAVVAANRGSLNGVVTDHIYLGTDTQLKVRIAEGDVLRVRIQNGADAAIPEPGASIGLAMEAGAARLVAG